MSVSDISLSSTNDRASPLGHSSRLCGLAAALFGLSLVLSHVWCVYVDLWHESFSIHVPGSPASTVVTTHIHGGLTEVCFTVDNRAQCSRAGEGAVAWLHLNATRDGWSIAGQETDTPPYVSYPVYTGSSERILTTLSLSSVFAAFIVVLVLIVLLMRALSGPAERCSSGEDAAHNDVKALAGTVVSFIPAVIAFGVLTPGRVQLVDLNPYFQLCDGCTLVDHMYSADSAAVYMQLLIFVLNLLTVCDCFVAAKQL